MLHASSQVNASDASLPAKPDQRILTAAKGGSIVFLGSVFEYGSRLAIGVLLARLLGAEQFGLYNLALTAAMLASGLALVGLRSAMVRYVALFIGRKDTAGLWGTLQVGLGLTAILSLLAGGVLYALAPIIAGQLFHELRLVPLLRALSLIVPFLALNEIVAAATRGFKKMQYAVVAQQVSQPVIRLILMLVLAIGGLSVMKALTAFSLTVVIVFGFLVYSLNKLFSLKRPLRAARRDIKGIMVFSLPVYFSDLINTFGGNVQTVLLGAWNTVTTVGVFAVTDHVTLVGRMFHQAIVTASMPLVSELYGQGEREQLRRFYQTMTKWTLIVNLPMFLILVLFPEAILSIFGQSFVGGAVALTILAWGSLVYAGTGIGGVLLDMSGNTSLKLVNSVATIILTLGLNVLLIPRWGLVGAATATCAATIIVNVLRLLEVFFLFRLFPYNVSCVKPVIATLVTLVAALTVRQLLAGQTSLVYTLVNIIVLLVVYIGAILVLGLSQEDRAVLARVVGRMSAMLPR